MTRKENVLVLCKSIVTKLENNKSIAFPPRLRNVVADEVFGLVSPYIMTDEDMNEKAVAKLGANAEKVAEANFSESEGFKAAKKMVRESFGDDELNGFYFIKPLKTVSGMIVSYLMRSASIDEVYETDEDLVKMIVEIVKLFSPQNAH